MKKEILLTRIFQVWTVGLFAVVAIASVIAIYNLCTGNYTGTACREF